MNIVDARAWINWFEANRERDPKIPWKEAYRLTERERRIITSSIQQFERGENARGHSFRVRGRHYAIKNKDRCYPQALNLFIWEEQRHSAYLRRFMEQHGIPLRPHVWVDGVFRKLRRLAGLDCMIVVLLTAEIVAVSYYRALYQCTRSAALRAICARIVEDETAHLRFQGGTLAKLRRGHSSGLRLLREWTQLALLAVTSLVVWYHHGRVYQAVGIGFVEYWRSNCQEFRRAIEYSRITIAATTTCGAHRYAS